MKRTQVYTKLSPKRVKNYAIEHEYDITRQQQVAAEQIQGNEEIHYLHGKLGDDKVASTLEDLLKWDRVLYTNQIVSQKTLQEAFKPIASTYPKSKRHGSFDYGLGFQLDQHPIYGKVVYHNGGEPGLRVRFIRQVDHDKTIIFYSNAHRTYVNQIKNAILNILYNQPFEVPKKSVAESLKPLVLTKDSTTICQTFDQLVTQKNFYVRESELENLAGNLWNLKKYREGLWVLHLMVKQFPKSTNARYVLGEGYMETQKNELAVYHFEKLLKMLKSRRSAKAKRFSNYIQKLIKQLTK